MSEDPIEQARADGRVTLTEPEAKTLLAEAGVDVPDSRVVDGPDAAIQAANDVGYPVVCKVCSPAVTHKSEWGDGAGVAVGLDSPAAVETAAERIATAADETGLGGEARILVEEARDTDAGTEVILGGTRDPSFGPVVLAGLGGVFTEVFEDTSHRIAPIDDEEARSAIAALRSAGLLSGYRGRPPADVDALATALATLGDILCAREEIAEIDANPVLATEEGAIALDALVVLEAP